MYFLIDFENVSNLGMRGTEYLLSSDHVIVFYSASTRNMELYHLENIKKSGCFFDVCKLVKEGKNALDFYIATRLGEIFGTGTCKRVVLVTRDAGFQALRDYWANCAAVPCHVVLSENLERGMISSNEPGERARQMHDSMKNVDIGSFFAAYKESCKLRAELGELFADTAFSSRTSEMENILKNGKSAKSLYLETLRCFGRKDGPEVYRRLKSYAKL